MLRRNGPLRWGSFGGLLLAMGFGVFAWSCKDQIVDAGPAARPLSEVYSKLQALASLHSGMAAVTTLGHGASSSHPSGDSSLPILALEIATPEALAGSNGISSPRVEVVGVFHGDEQIGSELALALADDILSGYGSGTPADRLGRSTLLTIVPVANPWGYANSVRTTETGVDVNRDFSWPYAYEPGYAGSPTFMTTPESQALAIDARAKHYAISVELHSGSYRISLPWDYLPTSSTNSPIYTTGQYVDLYAPAQLLFQARGAAYAASVVAATGGAPGDFPVVEGCDWYYVGGSFADWLYGILGCPGYTIELSPLKDWLGRSGADRDAVVGAHEAALISLLRSATLALDGRVVDASGNPAAAKVTATPAGPAARALSSAPIAYTAFGLSDAVTGSFRISVPDGYWSLTATAVDSSGALVGSPSAAVLAEVGPDASMTPPTLHLP